MCRKCTSHGKCIEKMCTSPGTCIENKIVLALEHVQK